MVAFDGRIETFDAAGGLLTSWQHLSSGALPNQIGGVAVAASGTVYVADRDGLAALDASGNVGSRIAPSSQGLGQASGSLVPGPEDSVYALRDQRIQKFGPAGEFLGAAAGDRRAQWSSAAIAPDASIYVAENRFGGRSGVLRQLAPITSVDRTPPSITVDAFTRPAGRRATRTLGRLRYALSEDASLRVVLLRRASTRDPHNREFARYLHVARSTTSSSAPAPTTSRSACAPFGYQTPVPQQVQAHPRRREDAGNESKPARVSFRHPSSMGRNGASRRAAGASGHRHRSRASARRAVDVFGDLHGDRGPDGTGFIPKRSAFSSPVQPGPECPFRGASTSRPRVDSACHSYRSALESRSALAVVSALRSAGARAAIAAGPSTAARRRRHRRRGDAVDWLWAAAFCGSATRASARARAMLWWYTVASWAPVVLSSINLGQGANRSPTARQQAAIRGRRVGAHAT